MRKSRPGRKKEKGVSQECVETRDINHRKLWVSPKDSFVSTTLVFHYQDWTKSQWPSKNRVMQNLSITRVDVVRHRIPNELLAYIFPLGLRRDLNDFEKLHLTLLVSSATRNGGVSLSARLLSRTHCFWLPTPSQIAWTPRYGFRNLVSIRWKSLLKFWAWNQREHSDPYLATCLPLASNSFRSLGETGYRHSAIPSAEHVCPNIEID